MRKTIFLFAIIFTCSCQSEKKAEKESSIDTVLELIKENKEKEKQIDNSALARVSKDKSIRKVIEWYKLDEPYYRPDADMVEFYDLKTIKDYDTERAKGVTAMLISILEELDSSVMDDIISFKKFSNLEYLEIEDGNFAPYDFKGLSKLKTLNFDYIYDIPELPPSIGDLPALEHLVINGANELTSLPDNIYNLIKLKTLEISGFDPEGDSISSNIKLLNKLEYLGISYCAVNIPEEIGELTNLKELHIDNYDYYTPFEAIYSLPNLEYLKLNISKEKELQGISQLQTLKVMSLRTYFLTPEIADIKNLEGLILTGYNKESYPDELGQLKELKALSLTNYALTEAPDFIPELPNLKYLEVRKCDKLEKFGPAYMEMEYIELIQLLYNKLITEIPDNLEHLEEKIILKSS